MLKPTTSLPRLAASLSAALLLLPALLADPSAAGTPLAGPSGGPEADAARFPLAPEDLPWLHERLADALGRLAAAAAREDDAALLRREGARLLERLEAMEPAAAAALANDVHARLLPAIEASATAGLPPDAGLLARLSRAELPPTGPLPVPSMGVPGPSVNPNGEAELTTDNGGQPAASGSWVVTGTLFLSSPASPEATPWLALRCKVREAQGEPAGPCPRAEPEWDAGLSRLAESLVASARRRQAELKEERGVDADLVRALEARLLQEAVAASSSAFLAQSFHQTGTISEVNRWQQIRADSWEAGSGPSQGERIAGAIAFCAVAVPGSMALGPGAGFWGGFGCGMMVATAFHPDPPRHCGAYEYESLEAKAIAWRARSSSGRVVGAIDGALEKRIALHAVEGCWSTADHREWARAAVLHAAYGDANVWNAVELAPASASVVMSLDVAGVEIPLLLVASPWGGYSDLYAEEGHTRITFSGPAAVCTLPPVMACHTGWQLRGDFASDRQRQDANAISTGAT